MDIDSLTTSSSDYHDLVQFFDANKTKPFHEWLTFDSLLDKPGKQGIVGLFHTKKKNIPRKLSSNYLNISIILSSMNLRFYKA